MLCSKLEMEQIRRWKLRHFMQNWGDRMIITNDIGLKINSIFSNLVEIQQKLKLRLYSKLEMKQIRRWKLRHFIKTGGDRMIIMSDMYLKLICIFSILVEF